MNDRAGGSSLGSASSFFCCYTRDNNPLLLHRSRNAASTEASPSSCSLQPGHGHYSQPGNLSGSDHFITSSSSTGISISQRQTQRQTHTQTQPRLFC
ncbi:hypothetical protein TgHK011_003626 [Trichoderma gracile]|nr:hypothetical protein TgHK011_003626 [Trichoderma gracile]